MVVYFFDFHEMREWPMKKKLSLSELKPKTSDSDFLESVRPRPHAILRHLSTLMVV